VSIEEGGTMCAFGGILGNSLVNGVTYCLRTCVRARGLGLEQAGARGLGGGQTARGEGFGRRANARGEGFGRRANARGEVLSVKIP
jgi:hypothetical protein